MVVYFSLRIGKTLEEAEVHNGSLTKSTVSSLLMLTPRVFFILFEQWLVLVAGPSV